MRWRGRQDTRKKAESAESAERAWKVYGYRLVESVDEGDVWVRAV